MSIVALLAYADAEVRNNPDPRGRVHIAHWAANQIELLMYHRAILMELANEARRSKDPQLAAMAAVIIANVEAKK